MTLFVADTDTDDYWRAGEFYRDGHEIGVNGVSDKDTMASFISACSASKGDYHDGGKDRQNRHQRHACAWSLEESSSENALFIAMVHMSDEAKYEACASCSERIYV